MTRANTEQLKYTPWFAKAGAACSIVPISRFVNERIFALKGGGYGCLFSLTGVDEEGMTDRERSAGCPRDRASISTRASYRASICREKNITPILSRRFSLTTAWLSSKRRLRSAA